MTHSLNRLNIVALAVLLGAPGAGAGQEASPPGTLDGSAVARLAGGPGVEWLQQAEPGVSPGLPMLLQPRPPQAQERKNPYVAAGLEFLLPILGHAYAGNAKRGILPTVVFVGGFVGMVARIDIFAEADALDYLLLGAFVGGRIWGIASAAMTANEHNRSLSSTNADLALLPTPDGRLGVGVAFRF